MKKFICMMLVCVILCSIVACNDVTNRQASISTSSQRQASISTSSQRQETTEDYRYSAYYYRGEFHWTTICRAYYDDPEAVNIPYKIYYFDSKEEMCDRYGSRLCRECYPREAELYG